MGRGEEGGKGRRGEERGEEGRGGRGEERRGEERREEGRGGEGRGGEGRGGEGRGGEGRGGEGRGGEGRGGEGRGGEGRGGEGRGGEGRGGEGRGGRGEVGGEGRLASANARVEDGVSSEGFTTVVQPAANAGAAAFLVTMALGKFQGAISAVTPTGCLITRSRLSLAVVGTYARFASSANHSTKDAPYMISSTASAKG